VWWGQYKISEKVRNSPQVRTLSKEEVGAARDYAGDVGYWKLAQEVKEKYIDLNK
jgi:hypothetical protein